MLVSISEAAALIGVATSTLRRWEARGAFCPSSRTAGGHRRYDTDHIAKTFFNVRAVSPKETMAYARVSSHDQKNDLERQKEKLQEFCEKNHFENVRILSDLGSGMNYKKKGLKELLRKICAGQVAKLILTHSDRLLRFGSELIFSLCEYFGTEVLLISETQDKTFEEQLSADLIAIISVFTAKLYGKRSHANRKAA